MDNLFLSTYSPEEITGIIHNAVREAVKNSFPASSNTSPGEKLLTRKETADKLKVSLVTLNDWTKRGMIQSYLIGGRVLYKDSEIEGSLHKVRTVKY